DLRFDDMASTLRKQVPKLMAKTGASSVEFKVVIKGGKAVLKAMPKTE
ncbi:MAG: MXAN_5187 C-terminal domain-containing protein, partial [Myxococcota bacterium]